MVAAADVAGTSEMLERALDMPADERAQRLRRLRASVAQRGSRLVAGTAAARPVCRRQGRRPPSRALRDMVRTFEPTLRD